MSYVNKCQQQAIDGNTSEYVTGQECAFCHTDERCDPGLVCHNGICRNPTDPDVVCERNGFVFDYQNGVCTSEKDSVFRPVYVQGRYVNVSQSEPEAGPEPDEPAKTESEGGAAIWLGALGLGALGAFLLLRGK